MVERIALFIPNLGGAGAERVFVHLARGFTESGVTVDLVVLDGNGPMREYLAPGVRLIELNVRRTLLAIRPLVRYLNEVRPSILISALDHANIVALLARRMAKSECKVVVTEHSTLSIHSKNARNLQGRVMPMLVRRFYAEADAIVAVSEGVKRDLLAHGLPEDKTYVIYNPVVTPEMELLMRESVDHPWFQDDQDIPVVIGAGRLTKAKDFPNLIRAFAKSCRKTPMRLVILGEGEERPQLEALVHELRLESSVWLAGFVSNPYKYFARADLFVLSSRWEGFAMVLVEALAAGLPVVSTDCPHGPREILAGGVYGRLVPVGDAEALSDAMLSALSEDHNRSVLIERAQEFSYQAAVTRYLELIQMLVGE
ncbi:glycosyltransferase [Thermaerobacter subterraneus]|uniref:Glycosyltransferase n=1 Tax=Thermaerobacter subterraneus DSM 13965 TaxID=867903 RepID=K6QCA7_9FIRM|nr:glycosyltransferase [Thermaerobacter subterraneus]EKP94111.1 glycosyltransferase [Thermaerobacter subterraneus DSM 13965]